MPRTKLCWAGMAITCALTSTAPAVGGTAEDLVVETTSLPARSISVGSSDLVSAEAIDRLKVDIAAAAKAVCKEMNFNHTGAHWTRRACAQWSTNDALRQLDLMVHHRSAVAVPNQVGGVIRVRAK